MYQVQGKKAEDKVAKLLMRRGFTVLAQNWRQRTVEIDIIAVKHKTIYIVEVKYRANLNTGSGVDYVTTNKLHQLSFGYHLWSQHNPSFSAYQPHIMIAEVTGQYYDEITLFEID